MPDHLINAYHHPAQQGAYVHNRVYFVKLTYPENQSSKPSPHWVKLIVVK